jgi:hypothetical protein
LIGGFSGPYPSVALAKYRFTWPLARLTYDDDAIRLSPRGPLKVLMKPIVIPYRELISVEVRGGRIKTIDFDCRRRELQGIGFGAIDVSGVERLLDNFARNGVTVTRLDTHGTHLL